MESGHQRRPLTAKGHVETAKIADDIDTGQGGQEGTVAYLQGKAEMGAVAYCLAMGADGANVVALQSRLCKQGLSGGGKFPRHQIVGQPHAIYLVVARGAEGVQLASRCLWPGVAEGRLDPQLIASDLDQHGIYAVQAGAGHESQITLNHDKAPCDLGGARVAGRRGGRQEGSRRWASCNCGCSSLASCWRASILNRLRALPLRVSAWGRVRVRGFLWMPPTTNS